MDATREVGDGESSQPTQVTELEPASKRAKRHLKRLLGMDSQKNLSLGNLIRCLHTSPNASWQSPISGEFFSPVSMGKAEFKMNLSYLSLVKQQATSSRARLLQGSRSRIKYAEELGGDCSRLGYSIKVVMLLTSAARRFREKRRALLGVCSALTPSRALCESFRHSRQAARAPARDSRARWIGLAPSSAHHSRARRDLRPGSAPAVGLSSRRKALSESSRKR